MYALIGEQNPPAMILFRSLMATLLDKTEKILPTLTPEDLKDDHPVHETFTLMIIASNVSKRFGKLKVLDDVSVTRGKENASR